MKIAILQQYCNSVKILGYNWKTGKNRVIHSQTDYRQTNGSDSFIQMISSFVCELLACKPPQKHIMLSFHLVRPCLFRA